MSTPVYISDHKGAALGHLTEAFQGRRVVESFLAVRMNRIQALESALYGILFAGLLGAVEVLVPKSPPDPETGEVDLADADVATLVLDGHGAQLDQLGSLLATPRGGRTDADYLVLLKTAVLVFKSHGTTRDIESILAASGVNWDFEPVAPRGFRVTVEGSAGPVPLADFLRRARAAGVPVWYETNALALEDTLYWGSAYGTVTPPGKMVWGSAYGAVAGAGAWGVALAL